MELVLLPDINEEEEYEVEVVAKKLNHIQKQ